MIESFAALMLMGVRVREVRDLDEGHIWMPRRRLLLVDVGLSRAERADLTDWLIPAAADLGVVTGP